MADTPEEHLTEELLDRLLHSAKIETFSTRSTSQIVRCPII